MVCVCCVYGVWQRPEDNFVVLVLSFHLCTGSGMERRASGLSHYLWSPPPSGTFKEQEMETQPLIPRLSLYTGFLPRNVADFTSVAVVHKGCSLEPRIFLTTTATLSLRSLAGISIQAQVEGLCSAYNRAVETERNPFAGRGTRHESHGLRTPSAGFHKQRQDLPFNL